MTDYDELRPGTRVDRFVVDKTLGQGGMAVVYRVIHRQLQTRHALKVLTLPMKSVERRLLQEGRLQATLRHDNIVAVTDIIDVEGAPGLVMEYIDGPSLDELLQGTRLNIDQADALARGIIAGIAYVHGAGLVHRDLKPANVMVAITEGHLVPKVADFGLAKILAGSDGDARTRTRSGSHFGTPAYMSPEQIRDTKTVDKRADVFSLGAILYELVCGVRAFDHVDVLETFNRIADGDYVRPRAVVDTLPDRMADAINGALEPDRDKRLPDCETLLSVWSGNTTAPIPQPLGPWNTEILKRAEVLGSGGAGVTTIPDATRGETWSGSSLDVFSSEEVAKPAPMPSSPPPGRPWAVVVSAAMVALAISAGGVMLSLAVLGVGWMNNTSSIDPPMGPSVVAAPEVHATPAPPPIAIPAPPVEQPRERKRRTRTAKSRVAPTPAEPPPVEPPPAEVLPPAEVAPPTAPDRPPAGMGRVVLKGDARRVMLRASSGNYGPGDVPVGTYYISVFFDGSDPVDSGRLTVVEGETRTLTCHRALRLCK